QLSQYPPLQVSTAPSLPLSQSPQSPRPPSPPKNNDTEINPKVKSNKIPLPPNHLDPTWRCQLVCSGLLWHP
ncbi:MAG: hypothetical protein MK111_19860, partial [Crocosphaera sp.]|nr:hypothetical protein [Crocosphaera sp.]